MFFGDMIGEVGATVGTGDYELGGPPGGSSFVQWRSQAQTSDKVGYIATTRDAVKREIGWGVFSQGTPDKITRNVIKSSQADALVNWANDDVYYLFSVPIGLVMNFMLDGGLDRAAPGWMPDGATRWAVGDDALATLWSRVVKFGDDEIELGRHYVAEGIYAGSPRRKWIDAGAATVALTAAHIGQVICFDVTAAPRTLTLLAGSSDDVGPGFECFVLGYGSTTNGVILDPDGTDNVDLGTGGASQTFPPNILIKLSWNDAKGKWQTDYAPGPTRYVTGRRQIVLPGPIDQTTGLPTFWPGTNGALSIAFQNTVASPMVLTAAGGFGAAGTAVDRTNIVNTLLSCTGLTASRAATTPNYIYAVLAADGTTTLASTILAPIYQQFGAPSTTAGQLTFNISEMKMYLGNGASADPVFAVVLGEAATDSTTVISTVMYGYNGKYDSGFTSTLWSTSTEQVKNHNLGIHPERADVIIECTSADSNFAVGNRMAVGRGGNIRSTSSAATAWIAFRTTPKTVGVSLGSDGTWGLNNANSGVGISLTVAKWKYAFVADRGW
jgi:hypothetical protein